MEMTDKDCNPETTCATKTWKEMENQAWVDLEKQLIELNLVKEDK